MQNILVAGSNVYALRAIYKTLKTRKWTEMVLLTGAMSAIILYHRIGALMLMAISECQHVVSLDR